MHMGEVIPFPRHKIKHPDKATINKAGELPEAVGEIKDVYHLLKIKKVDDMMQILLPLMSQGFLAFGVQLHNSKNVAFMFETIRSVLHAHFGLEHPFQNLADNLFRVDEHGNMLLKPVIYAKSEPLTPTDLPPKNVSNTA